MILLPAGLGIYTNIASTEFIFSDTISANIYTGYTLYSKAVAAGWNQTDKLTATVTINSNVYLVGKYTNPTPKNNDVNQRFTYDETVRCGMLFTGNYPQGSSVTIINNGYIFGAGGKGAFYMPGFSSPAPNGYGYNASWGGNAIHITGLSNLTISINNLGTIAGGGGGGGMGSSSRLGGAGGAPLAPGGEGINFSGNTASLTTGGATATYAGSISGAGGNPGYAGNSGNYADTPAFGAAPGKAVYGNSSVTWLAVGTLLGGTV